MFENYTEEQQEICRVVAKIASSELPKYESEQHYNTVPRDLFRAFAEAGVTGLHVPEKFDGIEASPTTVALVIEELAAVNLGPAIFLSVHAMVSGLINKFGNEEQQQRFLPKLASGEYLGAFALTEPQAGSDASGLKTSATKEGEEFILNGEKCYITSAGWADLYLVFAKTSPEKGKDGISAFVVEADTPGLTVSPPEKKMGCELSPIASLNFSNARVPASNLIGEIDRGYRVALGGLAGGRINVAAAAVGVSRTALDLAAAHLKERKQFGEPLINFQGLQFMLADMKIKLDAARLLTMNAAATLENSPSDRANRLKPSVAKCFATDAAMEITTDAVQLLGGAGYIKEYRVESLMRDAKMLQIVEGANQVQRMVIAREFVSG